RIVRHGLSPFTGTRALRGVSTPSRFLRYSDRENPGPARDPSRNLPGRTSYLTSLSGPGSARPRRLPMMPWWIVFVVMALVAATYAFVGPAGGAAGTA